MQKGHELTCIRRPGSQTRIKIKHEPVWVYGQLNEDFASSMEGCDAFVNMAACGVSPQKATNEELIRVNVVESFNLIQSAVNSGIKLFLLLGTSDEYGISGMRYKFIPPDAPLKPVSNYAASKAALFQLIHAFANEKELKLIYARIFSAYGIGQHVKNLWPSMRKAALSGEDYYLTQGKQVRAFIPVEEVVKQLVKLLDFSNVETGIPLAIQIGSDKPQNLKDFSEQWWKKWGATGKLHFGTKQYRKNEVMRYVPLIKKLK